MPQEIKLGTIVYANLDDHHGNVSPHYAIVIDTQEAIDRGDDLAVVGISTTCAGRMQDDWFSMESHPEGHPRTGLKQACVAKANWRHAVPQRDILRISGRALVGTVRQIIDYIKNHP